MSTDRRASEDTPDSDMGEDVEELREPIEEIILTAMPGSFNDAGEYARWAADRIVDKIKERESIRAALQRTSRGDDDALARMEAEKPQAHDTLSVEESYRTLVSVFGDVQMAHMAISRSGLSVHGLSILDRVHLMLQRIRGDEGRDAVEGWRPIDSAPRDGTRIMLWNPNGLTTGAWSEDQFEEHPEPRFVSDGCSRGAPTHWMPLPAPPGSVPEERAVERGREEPDWRALCREIFEGWYCDDVVGPMHKAEAALRSAPAASEEPR